MSKRAIRAHYEPRIARHRENYAVLDWASAASQRARFQVFVDGVDLRGRSLLDVGSGLGDLWAFLRQRKIPVDYTGVDLLEKMVEAARRLHPEARFHHADIFQENPFGPKQFDVSFGSGIFNLNLGNNREFMPRAVGRLLELSRRYVVFNLLHRRAQSRPDVYAYFEPEEVLALLKGLPCSAKVVDNYLPNDFTVICRLAPPPAKPGRMGTAPGLE